MGGKPDAGASADLLAARHGLRRRRLRERRSCCSIAGSPRSRSGTPCSTPPASCCSASRGSSRCTRSLSTNALQLPSRPAATTRRAGYCSSRTPRSSPCSARRWVARKAGDARIDQLEPIATSEGDTGAVEEIFAEASRDRTTAARKVLAYLQAGADPRTLMRRGAAGVPQGDDAHDYKFSSAVLEDYYNASPTCAIATWPRAWPSCPARSCTGTTTWSGGHGRP